MASSTTTLEPETVIFNAKFCGKKNVKQRQFLVKNLDVKDNNTSALSTAPAKIFDIKKARSEIIKFGLTGFDKEQQTDIKIAMAIKLGAKPRKKKPVNYKILMEQKRKEKEAINPRKKKPVNYKILMEQKRKEKEAINNARENKYTLQQLKQRKKSSKKQKLKNQPNSLV